MPPLYSLTCTLPDSLKEIAIGAFLELGIESLLEESSDSAGDNAISLTCYSANKDQLESASTVLQERLHEVKKEVSILTKLSTVEDRDWNNEWKKFWKPTQVTDNICICPAWENYQPRKDELVIYLENTNGFGTGTHESTQIAIQLLEELPSKQKVKSFLDIGTGSGILAILAKKLGISEVKGIDIETQAIESARVNAKRNEVDGVRFEVLPASALGGKFKLVCANMISSQLNENWTNITSCVASEGTLILSGLLAEEIDEFLKRHENYAKSVKLLGEWAGAVIEIGSPSKITLA